MVDALELLRNSLDVLQDLADVGKQPLKMLVLPCNGVRYSVVWWAWLASLPTPTSNSGRLVIASMHRSRGSAAVPAPPAVDQRTGLRHGLATVGVLHGEAAQPRANAGPAVNQ